MAHFGGLRRGQKTPILDPPGGGVRGPPGRGSRDPPGRGPGGRKLPPRNRAFVSKKATSVPTGRVIKYPRKCTPGGPGRPPGSPPAGGVRDPPKWGVRDPPPGGSGTPLPGGSPGRVRDPQNTPARDPPGGVPGLRNRPTGGGPGGPDVGHSVGYDKGARAPENDLRSGEGPPGRSLGAHWYPTGWSLTRVQLPTRPVVGHHPAGARVRCGNPEILPDPVRKF